MTKVTTIDAFVPDYDDQCMNCGASPTVAAVAKGKLVYQGHLCGPCTWGDADMLDPGNWNGGGESNGD